MRHDPAPGASLTQHIAPLEAGDHVVLAGFLGDAPFLALGEGTLALGGRRYPLHEDGMLVATVTRQGLLTGGGEGRVILTAADGTHTELAQEKGRWIDAVALGAEGSAAWAFGKTARARDAKGAIKSLDLQSSCQGLAFRPKGYQLAVAQNGCALVWMPNVSAAPERLDWKGSHLDISWSPDARYVVTSMQENQLHGWRLPEKAHMRMSGYPAKPRSMSWSSDGNWLATSGAEAAIVWPFMGKDGPMGKAPRECGVRNRRVSRVAFHPKTLVLAIGYEDGFIVLSRLTDGSELLVRAETKGQPVTALAWDAAGARLIFGTADGAAGILSLPTGA